MWVLGRPCHQVSEASGLFTKRLVDKPRMRRKLLGGNWKLNCSLRTFEIAEGFREHFFASNDTFLAVPFPYIQTARERLPSYIKVAAQDCSRFRHGAYTGEVSAAMIREMGAEYVIIGHSERRRWFDETPEVLADKIRNANDEGLSVVLCVGESMEERENETYLEAVKTQIYSLERELRQRDRIDIAYEPVWAVGMGKTPTEDEIREMGSHIKIWLKDIGFHGRVVYGGSVSMLNCQRISNIECLDGFLIGTSSLKMDFCIISSEMNTDD